MFSVDAFVSTRHPRYAALKIFFLFPAQPSGVNLGYHNNGVELSLLCVAIIEREREKKKGAASSERALPCAAARNIRPLLVALALSLSLPRISCACVFQCAVWIRKRHAQTRGRRPVWETMGLAKRNRRAARRHPRRRRPPRPESSDSETFMSTLFSSSLSDSFPSDDPCDDRQRDNRATPGDLDCANRNARREGAIKAADVMPLPTPAATPHRTGEPAHGADRGGPPTAASPQHRPEVEMRDGACAVALHVPRVASSVAVPGAPIPTPLETPVSASVLDTHAHATVSFVAQPHAVGLMAAAVAVPFAPLPLPGPRPAFTILRQAAPAAAREYAALPTVRPWRELARAVDPTGRMALDAHAVWCGDDTGGVLTLPTRFDGRRRWGRLLTPSSDQGLSGACWAYAVVSALGDRAALWTQGATRSWPDGIPRARVFGGLSARDLIDRDFDALTDAQAEGEAAVVAANQVHHGTRHADYGHTLAGALEALYVDGVGCRGGWRCRPLAYYGLAAAAQVDLKAEIFAWGPVASAFALYEDFMHPARYPSSWTGGVYRHDPDACRHVLGGHAVVLVGWCEAWLPDRHCPPQSLRSLDAAHHQRHHHHHTSYQALHDPLTQRYATEPRPYLPTATGLPMSKHTCWIARHAWGPAWTGAAAHADGHFVIVAGQCHIEANVVACVPDIHGMSLDPRDAHRVAPPSAAARARRAQSRFESSADLLGPDRIDPALLPDMSAFVAGEIYVPDDGAGAHRHDNGIEYADSRRPPSDAWSTALRRAWTPPEREDPHAIISKGGLSDDGRGADNFSDLYVAPTQGPDGTLPHASADDHHRHRGEGALYFSTGAHDSRPVWDRGYDAVPPAVPETHGQESVADYGDQRYEGACHSNSDAELSDDERRLDTQHRALRRGRRRPTQPRAWSDAAHHRDAW